MWELIKTAPGDQILDFTGFDRRWRRAVKRAGLKDFQFRDLRRTAATTLHDHGAKLRTVSAMLGHSSVTTTIRYLGLKEESLKEAGDILAAKYRPLAKDAPPSVESVPKSVPQILENGLEKIEDRI